MAKLDGIKVVNENTVEYNGFVYGLVTDDAQKGDLAKATDQEIDVTEGAFYLVTGIDVDGDIRFEDDVNDTNLFYQGACPIFRKSHAITNDKLTDAEGVVKIELPDGTKLEGTPSDLEKITRSMQKMQAEQVATVEMPEEAVEVEGEDELVSERLQVGDFAKVIEEGIHSAKVGDIVKIFVDDKDNQPFKCEDLQGNELVFPWFREHELVRATEAEVKAATEPKEEPLKVGDYAKLISTNFNTNAELNEIVVINVEDKTVIPYGIKNLKGEEIGWAPKDHLVKATGAEVQMAMREAKQALLKVNDYARIISNEATTEACAPHEFEVGTVLKLHEFDSDDNTFETRHLNGDEPDAPWVHRKDLEPLTQEEAEHIAREAEEEKKAKAERVKWTAIGREVGELRDGDVVQFTESTGTSEFPEDSVAIITNVSGDEFNFGEDGFYDGESSWVKLIVPVEQRFDTVG